MTITLYLMQIHRVLAVVPNSNYNEPFYSTLTNDPYGKNLLRMLRSPPIVYRQPMHTHLQSQGGSQI